MEFFLKKSAIYLTTQPELALYMVNEHYMYSQISHAPTFFYFNGKEEYALLHVTDTEEEQ